MDLIDDFESLADGINTPSIYRKWCGISLVAGAAEKRVWIQTGDFTTYLNLFVLLVGRPGTGKFIIETARQMWKDVPKPGEKLKAFHVAPSSMSKASLMDTLGRSKQVRITPDGPAITYHSVQIAAEELGVLLPAYDMEYISALVGIYSNPPEYTEVRRASEVKELSVENPNINLIAGSQPSYLETFLPDNIWNSGLGRRLIMVYSAEEQTRSPFYKALPKPGLRQSILERLANLSIVFGEISWSEEAQELFESWAMSGAYPQPDHSKLVSYLRSRFQNIMKLCGVAVLSRGASPMMVLGDDFLRAKDWLIEAETVMPDLFREMKGKSDSQLLEALHRYCINSYVKYKEGIPESMLFSFLGEHAPVEKVGQLMFQAERSHMLARRATPGGKNGTETLWIPRPKYQHDVE